MSTTTPSECEQCTSKTTIREMSKNSYGLWDFSKVIEWRMFKYDENYGEAMAIQHGLPITEYNGTDPKYTGGN